jgi:hypothetical protein
MACPLTYSGGEQRGCCIEKIQCAVCSMLLVFKNGTCVNNPETVSVDIEASNAECP